MSSTSFDQSVPLTAERIRRRLAQSIGREWSPGDRLPPVRQLAEQMGEGYRNTFAAVQALVAEGRLVARRGIGTFVTQAPTKPTGGALTGKSIVICHAGADAFCEQAIEGFSDDMRATGATLRLWKLTYDMVAASPPRFMDDALVLINVNMASVVMANADRTLCVIDTDQYVQLADHSNYDVVSVDSRQGGQRVGHHARALGIESACFVGCWTSSEWYDATLTTNARLQGFEEGWGRSVLPEHRLNIKSYTTIAGAHAAAEYVNRQNMPRFVFCASDDIAVGFMHGMEAHRRMAGRDYLLVGFDGQHRAATIPGGPISTVDVPMRQMGRTAARMLAERLAEPALPSRRVHLGCEFLQGRTTPIPGATA